MANLLTLCFYENPAALHEIKAWEKTKIKEIISIQEHNDGRINYLIQRSESQMEVLICFPQQYMRGYDINQEVNRLLEAGDVYHKTLVFGKFNSSQLRFLSIILENYEKFGT